MCVRHSRSSLKSRAIVEIRICVLRYIKRALYSSGHIPGSIWDLALLVKKNIWYNTCAKPRAAERRRIARRIGVFITCKNIIFKIFLHITQLKKLIENIILQKYEGIVVKSNYVKNIKKWIFLFLFACIIILYFICVLFVEQKYKTESYKNL